MPAPVLRHYTATTLTDNVYVATTAVPAGRALVIAKITVTNASGVTAKFDLLAGANEDPSLALAWDIQMGPGQVYTETGIVLTAGESIRIRQKGTTTQGTYRCSVFGEEVDN